MKPINGCVAAVALLVALASPARAALMLTGPQLAGDMSAWPRAGIQFTALRDGILDSFTFSNQGQEDTVYFTDASGAVLESWSIPADHSEMMIELDRPISAGATYQLIAENPDNGRWAPFAFPAANNDIRVNYSIGMEQVEKAYWFSFGDLVTEAAIAPVPEPASLLVLLACPIVLARRLRR